MNDTTILTMESCSIPCPVLSCPVLSYAILATTWASVFSLKTTTTLVRSLVSGMTRTNGGRSPRRCSRSSRSHRQGHCTSTKDKNSVSRTFLEAGGSRNTRTLRLKITGICQSPLSLKFRHVPITSLTHVIPRDVGSRRSDRRHMARRTSTCLICWTTSSIKPVITRGPLCRRVAAYRYACPFFSSPRWHCSPNSSTLDSFAPASHTDTPHLSVGRLSQRRLHKRHTLDARQRRLPGVERSRTTRGRRQRPCVLETCDWGAKGV
jgi:hypothetical protein